MNCYPTKQRFEDPRTAGTAAGSSAFRPCLLGGHLSRRSSNTSHMQCADWSASDPTCCWPMPTGRRRRRRLQALDFHVHVDLFMNPSAEYADIVLPATSPFEARGAEDRFRYQCRGVSLVQLRQPLVPPIGEARPDIAHHLRSCLPIGTGRVFLEWRRRCRLRHPSRTERHVTRGAARSSRRFASAAGDALPQVRRDEGRCATGFQYALAAYRVLSPNDFSTHGYAPLPDYEEPLVSPRVTPELVTPLSTGPDLHQRHALLRKPASRVAEPAPACSRSPSGPASAGCGRTRNRRRRLGADRNTEWRSEGPSAIRRHASTRRGMRPAWLVAGLRRARGARLSGAR